MRWYATISSFFRNLFHRREAEKELEAELNSFVEEQAARNRARGMEPSDALRQE